MSRITALFAAFFLCLLVSGCGSDNTGPTANQDELAAYLEQHGDQSAPDEE